MNFLKALFHFLLDLVSFRSWRARRARERYDFLKARISDRHFAGYAGLIVDDIKGRKFGPDDRACFRAPMYYWVKNADMKWCVFWHRKRLSEEIGEGPALRDGEIEIKDTVGRTLSIGTPNNIDEKAPPVVQAVPDGQSEDV